MPESKSSKKMEVIATKHLKQTRYNVFTFKVKEINRADFQALRAGGSIKLDAKVVAQWSQYFEKVKESNNG